MPGAICVTPRALAADSAALLNPLSCQAIASASARETPFARAIVAIWPAVMRIGVAWGAAVVLAAAGSPTTVPAHSGPLAPIPLSEASSLAETPARFARPSSVSPGRTVEEL